MRSHKSTASGAKRTTKVRKKTTSGTKKATPPARAGDLESLVGKPTYRVWVDMLGRLAPDGRTHRVAVVVAAMLQYAAGVAYEKYGGEPEEGTLAASLFNAAEWGDPEEIAAELSGVLARLFDDAGVPYERTDHRGSDYSMVDSAISEYVHWHSMPWE
ncbi:MAG: hypothetical protein KAY32_16915 [Candidatus Eisenbacteria sp.]|nr:hypothetical protein [Candidatus Eisenbacteria bacterium]